MEKGHCFIVCWVRLERGMDLIERLSLIIEFIH